MAKSEERRKGNLDTSRPASPSGLRKHDPDKVLAPQPAPLLRSAAEPTGPLIKAKVAKNRTLHIPDPSGKKDIVGRRPVENDGVVTFTDITQAALMMAGPGTEVELPESEVRRLQSLGFLESPDGRYSPAPIDHNARILNAHRQQTRP